MDIDPQVPWFGPRRYGWGWGPGSWQGWAIVGAYVFLSAIGACLLLDAQRVAGACLLQVLLSVALLAVCIVKGAPPARHRGRE